MVTKINLIVGEVYYHAAFYDPELSIPSISTYVYEGYDEEHGHMFIDAEGYLEKKQGEELSDDAHVICYPDGSVASMIDKENLIAWLEIDHSPSSIGETYEFVAI